MTDRLTVLDATFLELEQLDQGALMNIGGVMVFEPPRDGHAPGIERVRRHLAARLGRLPRYSQRLSSTRTGSWSWPRWTQDERFDIRGHIRHASLPMPGSDEQLCDWTADFFSHPLDRTRPLWEIVLIEGLADGRWALGWKTHHCLVDGVGSVDIVGLMLDPEQVATTRTTHDGAVAPPADAPDADAPDAEAPDAEAPTWARASTTAPVSRVRRRCSSKLQRLGPASPGPASTRCVTRGRRSGARARWPSC